MHVRLHTCTSHKDTRTQRGELPALSYLVCARACTLAARDRGFRLRALAEGITELDARHSVYSKPLLEATAECPETFNTMYRKHMLCWQSLRASKWWARTHTQPHLQVKMPTRAKQATANPNVAILEPGSKSMELDA